MFNKRIGMFADGKSRVSSWINGLLSTSLITNMRLKVGAKNAH